MDGVRRNGKEGTEKNKITRKIALAKYLDFLKSCSDEIENSHMARIPSQQSACPSAHMHVTILLVHNYLLIIT